MIDPVGMTLRDWADSTILSLRDAWLLPRLDDEERWQDWGVTLLREFANESLPNPYFFSDWREWAQRVYPYIEGKR
jgi:hypothetical protein